MTRNKTGNNQFLKKYNETGILELIRVRKAVSRAELSEVTGLSATAIGAITSGLAAKGYVHETGIGESRGGRRPVLLELKPDSFYSVGIDVDVDGMRFVLLDITGKVAGEKAASIPDDHDYRQTGRIMAETVRQLLAEHAVTSDALLGIGISVPGMVDHESRHVILAPNLGWENADIGAILAEGFPVPVYVENEAMASAICENWLGACQNVGNFVCINIKSGIGAGIFTGGRLYRGAGGSAGEVGHIVVDENGPKCGCGNYGCLETLASTARIVERAQRMVRQGVSSSLNTIEPVEEIDIAAVVKAARNEDEVARTILLESARYLGIALSNLVNTLNPSRIVLGKEFVRYGDLVMDRIKEVVKLKALASPVSRVDIMASELGEKTSMLGAAIIPLKVLFGR